MAWKNLGEFLRALESQGDLVRVRSQVASRLEITEIALRALRRDGPALLFENVGGSKIPVAINVLASPRRIASALGASSVDEPAERIRRLLRFRPPAGLGAILTDPAGTLEQLQQLRALAPKRVNKGACQEEETDRPDLDQLPILTCWPKDGGPTITFPLVVTRNPETGDNAVGVYRLQKYSSSTLGAHWQTHRAGAENFRRYQRRGERMPVAVVIGADPATVFAGLSPVPEGISRFAFSGFLRGESLPLVPCRTVPLEVPAEAEIVLEGYADPKERHVEGPFGDHTGYYSLPEEFPVIHITHVTHRSSPVYLTTVTGKPPTEDAILGQSVSRLFLPVIQAVLPEVVDLDLPLEGIFINVAIVAIRKSYPQHARKVMHALWGLGQMMFTRYIVVVDHDVDPHDHGEVLYRVGLQADPQVDLEHVFGPVDQLSVSNREENQGGKLGIDATKKWKEEGYPRPWPEEARMDPAVVARVDELLKSDPVLSRLLPSRPPS
ncbi:MAG: menaquinone biosynthesis decarboxylase [Euryarchaeota archaeon]|nr:menaquinone biosynthesis decarboxylase [Euryarchaeota archaeon]MDE1836728.1 menaquinone biosynthesis decarboxylase [Euryarchaeota archaeon]MDE1881757.1 menaquinone biosynthesis decarboxylase [Euryarchaeota archaeon]MDE2044712.1 menaquinone biosynthesis decarboxylase [Thermoplasmata archaeon]